MNDELSKGVLYYEYIFFAVKGHSYLVDDIFFCKHKRYGTIYTDEMGKYKIKFENWYKEYYLDDEIIGIDIIDDEDSLHITMFSFNENDEAYFIRRVVAYLLNKYKKEIKDEEL